MAKKKQPKKTAARPQLGDSVEILDAGSVLEEPITQTLETNYMPYAMSVIVSRALPEIDGFKPAHRKLLYTMYDMGLLKGNPHQSPPTSWASTMQPEPPRRRRPSTTPWCAWHAATRALLAPLSWTRKGNFGKAYSPGYGLRRPALYRGQAGGHLQGAVPATSTRTPWILWTTTTATTQEPTLLPATFPSDPGQRQHWASPWVWRRSICSFNLAEVCRDHHRPAQATRMHDIRSTLPAPDFAGGGYILYDEPRISAGSMRRAGAACACAPDMST